VEARYSEPNGKQAFHGLLESELLYDLLFTYKQFLLATSPLRLTTSVFFFQPNSCGVTSSLKRRWVCRLQSLLVFASAVILGSKSRATHDHNLLSQIRDSPNLGGSGPRIYIPQEQGGPVIPPGTEFPFRCLLRLAGLRWRYSNPPPHGINCWILNPVHTLPPCLIFSHRNCIHTETWPQFCCLS
jgi:hypothetical protein